MSISSSNVSDGSRLGRRYAARSFVLALATFAVVLDLAGVVILLPSIQAELHAGVIEATWIVAAFVIAAATTIPLGTRLAARFGPRRVLLAGLGVFGLASLAAALSPSVSVLIAARAIQGLGAALVEPAIQGVLRGAGHGHLPKQGEQAQGLAVLLAAALGPILPAALATAVSWRAQFWLDVVLAGAIIAAAWRTIAAVPRQHHRPQSVGRDVVLTGLGVLAAVGLFFAVINGPQLGGDSAPVIVAAVVAMTLLATLITIDLLRQDPLLPLHLLRRRRYAASNVVRALTEFTSLGVFFALSGYLQDELGHSPLIAGLLLMPIILGALVTAPIAEKYGERADVRWFLIPGFLCAAGGVFWLAHVAPDTPWWFFLAPLAIAGAGIGAVESPTELAIRDDTPDGAAEAGWRLSRVSYLWGIGAGVATVSAIWQSTGINTPQGVNSALLVCAITALVAAAATITLSTQRASPPSKVDTAELLH